MTPNEFYNTLSVLPESPRHGDASAVLIAWRETTVDVDLKLAPEPNGVFAAIADAKAMLNINVELAAPDDFIPPLRAGRAAAAISSGTA